MFSKLTEWEDIRDTDKKLPLVYRDGDKDIDCLPLQSDHTTSIPICLNLVERYENKPQGCENRFSVLVCMYTGAQQRNSLVSICVVRTLLTGV